MTSSWTIPRPSGAATVEPIAAAPPLPAGRREAGRAPADEGLTLEGDPTGASVTYVRWSGGRLHRAGRLRELLLATGEHGLELDETALSHLLHDGFVPFPRTVFKGVHALGIGDRVTVAREDGGRATLAFAVDFPYLGRCSRADQRPDPDHLLRLLCASLERSLVPHAGAALMLSSGLDSVPLGLAAAEIGRAADVTALTFDQHGSGEGQAAAVFARRFGLRHRVLGFPRQPQAVAELALEFFASADQPCCDPVTLAYAATLRQAGVAGGLVLDGSGSDVYLGEVPSFRTRALDALHRLPGSGRMGALRALLPFRSPLNKVLSSRSEKTFADAYHLRHRETRRFFAGSVDTSARWRLQDRELAGLGLTDVDALVGGRHQDASRGMLKARLATQAHGADVAFPWCDADLIAYCFHLPDDQRRGGPAQGNKPLVRALLRRHADYDVVTQRKKVIFSFFLPEVLRANRTLVEHEVRSCRLWAPSVREALAALWAGLDERRETAVALHTLFSLSAWLNHARVLGRRPASDAATGRATAQGAPCAS